MIAELKTKKMYWCGCFSSMGLAGREREESGQICLHYINRVYMLYYHGLEFPIPR